MAAGTFKLTAKRQSYRRNTAKSSSPAPLFALAVLAAVLFFAAFCFVKTSDDDTLGANNRQASAHNFTSRLTLPAPPPTIEQAREAYGQLPMSFEANRGQAGESVNFVARGAGYTLALSPTAAAFGLRKADCGLRNEEAARQIFKTGDRRGRSETNLHSAICNPQSAVLRMNLVGANAAATVAGQNELEGKVNYFIGNDPAKWRTDVPTFGRVRYAEVYPGIDVVYYGNQRRLEYDFVVAPGRDARAIALEFAGAERVEVEAATGDLLVHVGEETIRQHAPVTYQEVAGGGRREVESRYALRDGGRVGFEVGEYDRSAQLVIDPVLVYSTYLGGSDDDSGNGIAVDSAGNAYVTGETFSLNFPTANPFQGTHGSGSFDVFVTKINAAGTALVYSTYLGGTASEQGFGIAVDSAGNAYVTGTTRSANFPTVNPIQGTEGGDNDVFVTKINPDGSGLVYSTFLGGSEDEFGNDIAVDSAGNAYVTGETLSTNFPTANSIQGTFGGGFRDAFVTKINPDGSGLIYSTFLGGGGTGNSGEDIGFGIAADAAGNAYVTGKTLSTTFPTVNPFDGTYAGFGNIFVTKINATGSALVYSTYIGTSNGSGGEVGNGIAVDSAGNAYITGLTSSTDFPTVNPIQGTRGSGSSLDAFVTKINAAGTALVYSTYLGGSGEDEGNDIAVDSAGNAYVIGRTFSTDFPTTNPIDGTLSGDRDAFVTKINAAGTAHAYSTYIGGNSREQGFGIAVDSAGHAYITGSTNSTNFPTANPIQGTPGGFSNAFVAKIDEAGTTTPTPTPTPTPSPTPTASPTPQPTPTGPPTGRIAFDSVRQDSPCGISSNRLSDIYLMNANGANETRLTNNPGFVREPSITSDGTRIAFWRVPDDGFDTEIYLMNADGTNQTRLTNNSADDEHPSISGDGTRIAFISDRDDNTNNDIFEIYVMNTDGTNQTRVTDLNLSVFDGQPSISRDGTRIAFVNAGEIHVMNADGSNLTQLTNAQFSSSDPSFSPDGGRIAFVHSDANSTEIFVMNANGSNRVQLTNNALHKYHPSFSPEGTRIAFMSEAVAGTFDTFIFTMNADGSNPTRLTNNPNDESNPSWGGGDSLPPPAVATAINPAGGPEAGGTPVTITGSGFLGGTITVSFGQTPATDVVVVNDTTITATAPPGRGQILVNVRKNNAIPNTDGVLFTYDPLPSGSNAQPAVTGTAGDGNLGIVFPRPNDNLPAPVQNVVTGLPAGARPHGVDYFEADKGIISDFANSRVFIVRISTNSLLETINTPGYDGRGTIAVAPTFNFALASGFTDALTVISAPFNSASAINTIPLPGVVVARQTQAIVFNSAGRAFVYHSAGISVLDAPYTSIAFTIPVNNFALGAIAITPDGNTLLATGTGAAAVSIFTAPFSASSTPTTLIISGAAFLNGIRTTPDGGTAIVVPIFEPKAYAITAPFNSSSTVEQLPIAPCVVAHGRGFEDLDISPDGQLAILTGQSSGAGGGAPAAFIRAPFTAAGARSFAVNVQGGRGAGSVRFLPRSLSYVLNVSKSAPATVNSGANLTYTINYSNTGFLNATNAVIRDPLPAGTTFVSATNGGTLSGNTVVFNVGTINAGSTQSVSFTVNVTAASGSTVTNSGYTLEASSIASFAGAPVTTTVTPPAAATFQFSQSSFAVSESAGFVNVNVMRSGDTSTAGTVDYTTSDNSDVIPDEAQAVALCGTVNSVALSKCDFNTALGTLRFASGETTKSFTVLLTQDSYVEGTEFAPLTLSNPTNGAVLGNQSTAMLQIIDDPTEPSTNAIDDARNFVRQHYHDFLNREPDQAGWDFWTDNITKCNDPARRPAGQTVEQCIDKQRETTSGAFFLSPEFQYTGSYIYCVYKGSFNRRPTFLEFMRDLPQLVNGIIVGGAISGSVIEANRAQYVAQFVQRSEFTSVYGGLSNQGYVDKLFMTTGTSVSDADKQALVNGLNGGTETRSTVLHKVVNGTRVISEGQVEIIAVYGKTFSDTEFNPSFVQMEYFGYMRRNEDTAGFDHWLGKLNFFGDFIKAEMVRSFLLSPEYRRRFGSQ